MNKVWLITGSNRGLGRFFAREAVRNGDKVIAASRKIDGADEFYQNENVLPVQMDVTDTAQIERAIKDGISRFGQIDILVNNAGFGMNGAFEETGDTELRTLFETDYFGVVNVTRAVLPVMRAQKSGRILNISSQAGLVGAAGCSAYNAAKFALVGMSEALSLELSPFGIQTAVVLPGSFRTDFRDSSSMKQVARPMDEYDGNAAHDVVQFLKDNNHKQQGDPEKAAEFLYPIATGDKPLPVHIAIGRICCDAIKQNLERIIAEIGSYYEKSADTDFADWQGTAF